MAEPRKTVKMATTALRGKPWLTLTRAALEPLETAEEALERNEETAAVAELDAELLMVVTKVVEGDWVPLST